MVINHLLTGMILQVPVTQSLGAYSCLGLTKVLHHLRYPKVQFILSQPVGNPLKPTLRASVKRFLWHPQKWWRHLLGGTKIGDNLCTNQICPHQDPTDSNFLGTPWEDYFKGNPKSLNFYFLVIWWGKKLLKVLSKTPTDLRFAYP